MSTIADHLCMLRDVQGVHGSFVIGASGSLVDRDLPAVFDDELFIRVGPRIVRLHESLTTGGREMDACMLRFSDHKLYLRSMSWGLMGVLLAADVNLPALRMVANLTIRRIESDVASGSFQHPASSPPPPRPSTFMRPTSPQPATFAQPGAVEPEDGRDPTMPQTPRHARMYRGRPVGE
jgi:predicted regulator of Ras-like GTPase activity (Roadblock/LC7/MglB family)